MDPVQVALMKGCGNNYYYFYYLYINVCVTLGVIAAYLFFKKNHRGVTNYF